VDPSGRQLTLMVTDGLGPVWQGDALPEFLTGLAKHGPTAVVQVLPAHLWHLTGVRPVRANVTTVRGIMTATRNRRPRTVAVVPILRLEPDWIASWAQLVAGADTREVPLTVVDGAARTDQEPAQIVPVPTEPSLRVHRFRAMASMTAFNLA